MVSFFGDTNYKALFEVKWDAADYNTAVGSQNGRAFRAIGNAPALAKDLNVENNNFLRIDQERKVYNKKFLERTNDDGKLALGFQDEPIPSTIRQALKLSDGSNETKFGTFVRYGSFYVFGDESVGAPQSVTVVADSTVLTLEPTVSGAINYGKNVWISSDMNSGDDEGVIVGASVLTNYTPVQGKIEFHRITKNRSEEWTAFHLDISIDITDFKALSTGNFYNGDFIWQATSGEAPSLMRICPNTNYFNP